MFETAKSALELGHDANVVAGWMSPVSDGYGKKGLDAGFLTGLTGLYKIDPLNDFLYGELHIILKPMNVKICDRSIFSIVEQKNV